MTDVGWNLRVHAPSNDLTTVYVRRHRFEVGAPVQFDEQYDRITDEPGIAFEKLKRIARVARDLRN